MNEKLEISKKDKLSSEQKIVDFKRRVTELRKIYCTHHDRVKDTRYYLDAMKRDLEDVSTYIQDTPVLKAAFIRMAEKYIGEKTMDSEKIFKTHALTSKIDNPRLGDFNKRAEKKSIEGQQLIDELSLHTNFLAIENKKVSSISEKHAKSIVIDNNREIDKNKRLLVEISLLKKKLKNDSESTSELPGIKREDIVLPQIESLI